MSERRGYQHRYYMLYKKASNARLRIIATPGYIPPRVRSTYKIRKRHVFSGVVFRMASFTADPHLRLFA